MISITDTQKKVTRRIHSAYPVYAAALVWLVMGLIAPIYKGLIILLTACLSAVAYFVLDQFVFKGRVVEVETPIDTGDLALNRQLTEGRERLNAFEGVAKGLANGAVRDKLLSIARTGRLIIDEVADDHREAKDLQTFFDYYLPTIGKLLALYEKMAGANVAGENIDLSIRRVENSLDMIEKSFEKELDSLYKNEAMDIKVDIKVLETMLKSEGLIDNAQTQVPIQEEKRNITMEGV